jgi:hypothetical protein
MADKITCIGPCGEPKDKTEFYGNSKKCKVCTLARQKELKAARANGTPAPKEKATRKGGGSKSRKAAKPVHTPNATWSRPFGFGFEASLQVDEEKKQTDILLKQAGSELGEQTVWLNQSEARELHSWLTEQLGAA